MALVQKLELRQGQQLVMTPQLQQAIRLLQLSNVELCSFVEAEVERNPLLESEEAAPEPTPDTQATQRKDDEDGDEATANGSGDWSGSEDTFAPNGAQRDAGEASAAPQLNGAGTDASSWAHSSLRAPPPTRDSAVTALGARCRLAQPSARPKLTPSTTA
jgi:RNA polymerase sigma-54 factor